jgi:hypothetical protein
MSSQSLLRRQNDAISIERPGLHSSLATIISIFNYTFLITTEKKNGR